MKGLEQGILVCGLCRNVGKCDLTSRGQIPESGVCVDFDKKFHSAQVIAISRGHFGLANEADKNVPVLTNRRPRRKI